MPTHFQVAGGRGLAEDLDALSCQVDQLDLRNPMAGIEGNLNIPVVVERGIGDFDQQQNVLRAGVDVDIPAILNDRHVWLRLVVVIEADRVLDIKQRFL